MKLVVANWKMNGSRSLIRGLGSEIAQIPSKETRRIIICPPFTLLADAGAVLAKSGMDLGGQDCSDQAAGAHTGDIAAAMLTDMGCKYVILGHSERRQDHRETDALIARKVTMARSAGLVPILCVGESLVRREAGQAAEFVTLQLRQSLAGIDPHAAIIIAYEPIWAIGTGMTASLTDIEAMHRHIADELTGIGFAKGAVPVLYGGSVKAGNARAIMQISAVDGVLVGGASLDADSFKIICDAALA